MYYRKKYSPYAYVLSLLRKCTDCQIATLKNGIKIQKITKNAVSVAYFITT